MFPFGKIIKLGFYLHKYINYTQNVKTDAHYLLKFRIIWKPCIFKDCERIFYYVHIHTYTFIGLLKTFGNIFLS